MIFITNNHLKKIKKSFGFHHVLDYMIHGWAKLFWQELKNKLQGQPLVAIEPAEPAEPADAHDRLQALDDLDDDGFQVMFADIVHGCVP